VPAKGKGGRDSAPRGEGKKRTPAHAEKKVGTFPPEGPVGETIVTRKTAGRTIRPLEKETKKEKLLHRREGKGGEKKRRESKKKTTTEGAVQTSTWGRRGLRKSREGGRGKWARKKRGEGIN